MKNEENEFHALMYACGMQPKGAARVLGEKEQEVRHWSSGTIYRKPSKAAMDTLTEISLAIKEITEKRK